MLFCPSLVFVALVSCAFMSVSLSPLPRRVGAIFSVLISIVVLFSVISVVLQLSLNRRWPSAIFGCIMGVLMLLMLLTYTLAIRWLTNELHSHSTGTQMDEASRARSKERIRELRHKAYVVSTVYVVGACVISFSAVNILSDTSAQFIQYTHAVSFPNWVFVGLCAWMLWFSWFAQASGPVASAMCTNTTRTGSVTKPAPTTAATTAESMAVTGTMTTPASTTPKATTAPNPKQ